MSLPFPSFSLPRGFCIPRATVLTTILTASLLAAADARATATATDLPIAEIAEAADRVAKEQIASGVPGLSVAVARNGEVVFARGYGHADIELGVPAKVESVYRIGSVSKQMTAAAIMRLVEAGKISLDDPLTKYMPDYSTSSPDVTIRHLLNHTSGIPGMRVRQVDTATRERLKMDLTEKEILGLFTTGSVDFAPGTDHKYNNSAYVMLGMIIGKVTGTPFHEYIERELFQPLGLSNTIYCDVERIVPNRAEGYEMKDGRLVNAPYLSMNIPGAAGAFCSTVGDLVKWNHLLHSGKVVSAESLKQMVAPTVLASGRRIGYGFGLDLDFRNGRDSVVHGGSINGFRASVAHYPAEGVTVAVLANSGDAPAPAIEKTIAQALFGIEIHDLPLTADDIRRYEGTYAFAFGERSQNSIVSSKDGQLFVQPHGGKQTRLRYQGEHRFITANDDDVSLQFDVADGTVRAVTLRVGAKAYNGTRQP